MASIQAFLPMVPPTVTHNDLEASVGRGGRPYIRKSERLREAEGAYMARLAPLRPARPLSGPLRLTVRWCFPTDSEHAQGEPMGEAPDLDNMCKSFQDCLTRAGIIDDDRHVVELRLSKAWSDPAGVWFRAEGIEGGAR